MQGQQQELVSDALFGDGVGGGLDAMRQDVRLFFHDGRLRQTSEGGKGGGIGLPWPFEELHGMQLIPGLFVVVVRVDNPVLGMHHVDRAGNPLVVDPVDDRTRDQVYEVHRHDIFVADVLALSHNHGQVRVAVLVQNRPVGHHTARRMEFFGRAFRVDSGDGTGREVCTPDWGKRKLALFRKPQRMAGEVRGIAGCYVNHFPMLQQDVLTRSGGKDFYVQGRGHNNDRFHKLRVLLGQD